MVMHATTLADLTLDQLGQLLDAEIYPTTLCGVCRSPQVVSVWGDTDFAWTAACGACKTVMPASYVTFMTGDQVNDCGWTISDLPTSAIPLPS
jgi:hypothetical protein